MNPCTDLIRFKGCQYENDQSGSPSALILSRGCPNRRQPSPPCGKRISRVFTAQAGNDATTSKLSGEAMGEQIHRYTDKLYAVHHFCPDDARHVLSPDGKEIVCSVHGSARAPRQRQSPNEDSAQGKLLRDFAGMTATLTFLKDGLHAVVVIDRK